MFYIYQIVTLLIILVTLLSLLPKESYRAFFSFLAALFASLEIATLYLTGKVIDYRFYNQFNIQDISVQIFQFVKEVMIGSILLLPFAFLLYIVAKRLSSSQLRHPKLMIPLFMVLFVSLSLPSGVLNEFYKIYEIRNAQEKNFHQALKDLDISPESYITPDKLEAKSGKNIIVISLESIEQGFLGSTFANSTSDNLTPHLTALSKEWSFYDKMPMSPGATFTSSSLYSYQVGVPAYFKGQGNYDFQGIDSVKLTGVGHILQKAGYRSRYLIGNAEYAGTSDLLQAYHIKTISEKNALGKYPQVENGLHDYDLFEEAKLQIEEFGKEPDRPFALFMSTINTHFPQGIYDKRMEKFVSKREDAVEFSVSAVDYLVGDLLAFLKEKGLLEDTAIYIFPDHLFMGNVGGVYEKLMTSPRSLYLMTNVDKSKFSYKTTDTIYQIDLPRMIIDGAEIESNAKFLVDYLSVDDMISYIRKNYLKFTTLNVASTAKKSYDESIEIKLVDNNLSIQSGREYTELVVDPKDSIFDMTFNTDMVLIDQNITNQEQAFLLKPYDKRFKRLHLVVFVKDNKIDKTYLGNKDMIGSYKEGDSIEYTQEEIETIKESSYLSFTHQEELGVE